MAGGIELATAYVTVLPSTKGLGAALTRDLNAQMPAIGKQAGGELSKGMGTAVVAGGMVAASAAIGAALGTATKAASAYGSQVLLIQRLTGESAQESSKWAAILGRYGVEGRAVGVVFKTLSTNIVGNTAAMKATGIATEDSSGKNRKASAVLADLADWYSKNTDKTQANAVAAKLLGRGYVALLPLLSGGRKNIEALTKAAQENGLVLGQEGVDAIKRYNASLLDLKDAQKGLEVDIGRATLPWEEFKTKAIIGTVKELNKVPDAAKTAGVGIAEVTQIVLGGLGSIGLASLGWAAAWPKVSAFLTGAKVLASGAFETITLKALYAGDAIGVLLGELSVPVMGLVGLLGLLGGVIAGQLDPATRKHRDSLVAEYRAANQSNLVHKDLAATLHSSVPGLRQHSSLLGTAVTCLSSHSSALETNIALLAKQIEGLDKAAYSTTKLNQASIDAGSARLTALGTEKRLLDLQQQKRDLEKAGRTNTLDYRYVTEDIDVTSKQLHEQRHNAQAQTGRVTSITTTAKAVGADVTSGFTQGMDPNAAGVAATKMGQAAIDRLGLVLGCHSPSTVMAGIGRDAAAGLAQGLTPGAVIAAVGRMLSGMLAQLPSLPGRFASWALVTIQRFAANITPGGVVAAVSGVATAAWKAISGLPGKFTRVAVDAMVGMSRGITSNVKGIIRAGEDMAARLIAAVKSFLGIHSPSTVFAGIGSNVVSGMVRGLNFNNAMSVIKRFFGGVWKFAGNVPSLISSIFASGDMSDIQQLIKGGGALVGKFGGIGGALAAAYGAVGKPYVWGASVPGAFDCSGLVSYILNALGLHYGRLTSASIPGALAPGRGNAVTVGWKPGHTGISLLGQWFEAKGRKWGVLGPGSARSSWQAYFHPPGFSGGGVSSGPDSGYPAVLHGTEGIFTAEQMRHLAPAGGQTVNLTVNADSFADERRIATAVKGALREVMPQAKLVAAVGV